MWALVCVLLMVSVTFSFCGNNFDYEGNYINIYENLVSDAQDEDGNSPPPPEPCRADLSRWDKVFIFLESSEMRQKMLQEAVEQCCVQRSRKGAELQQSAVERMNSTLNMLLRLRREDGARLKRLEEEVMKMMMMGRSPKETGSSSSSLQTSLTSIQSDLQKIQLQLNKVKDEAEETKKNTFTVIT